MPARAAAGAARMRALAADLPNGLLAGFRAGRELELPNGHSPTRLFAVGVGGSAIAADLTRVLIDAECRVTLRVVRSAELPHSVDAGARVILVSYSGETSETVRAYAAAGRAGAERVVVTSGGRLADQAEDDGVPVLRAPPGMPARAAIGHLWGDLLGILDPAFPESNEARLAAIAERLRPEIGRYVRAGGPAEEIAEAIGERDPHLVAESGFVPLARRWATQFEENAKRIAFFDEVPELFHNAIVGWSGLRRAAARRRAVLLFEWSGEDPAIRAGFRELERLLSGRGVRSVPVPLPAEDRLESLVQGVALGDQVSLRLAERQKVDPVEVEPIDRMRALLAGVPAGAASRPARARSRSP